MKAIDYILLVIVIAVFIISLILTRQGNVEESMTEKYSQMIDEVKERGAMSCSQRGMTFIGVTSEDMQSFTTLCYTKSPCKIYRFSI